MDVKTQPKLRFQGVTFTNVHFDAISRYDGTKNISISVVPKVFYPESDPLHFKIIMEVNLNADGCFDFFLNGLGEFFFEKEMDDVQLKKNFVNINAPAIMFPYVRAFISTFTGNLGGILNSLVIPTQFFQGELEEIVNNNELN